MENGSGEVVLTVISTCSSLKIVVWEDLVGALSIDKEWQEQYPDGKKHTWKHCCECEIEVHCTGL